MTVKIEITLIRKNSESLFILRLYFHHLYKWRRSVMVESGWIVRLYWRRFSCFYHLTKIINTVKGNVMPRAFSDIEREVIKERLQKAAVWCQTNHRRLFGKRRQYSQGNLLSLLWLERRTVIWGVGERAVFLKAFISR